MLVSDNQLDKLDDFPLTISLLLAVAKVSLLAPALQLALAQRANSREWKLTLQVPPLDFVVLYCLDRLGDQVEVFQAKYEPESSEQTR